MRTGPPTGARPVPARLVPTPPGAAAWPCWWLHVAAVRERSGEGEEGAEGGGEAELAALLLLLCAARHGALRLAPSRHKPCKTTTSKNPAAHPTLNPHNHGWIRGRQGWEKLLTGGVRGAGTPPTAAPRSARGWEPPRPPRCRFLSPHPGRVHRETPVSKKAPEGNRESEKEARRWGAGELGAAPGPAAGGGGAACKPHAPHSRSPPWGNRGAEGAAPHPRPPQRCGRDDTNSSRSTLFLQEPTSPSAGRTASIAAPTRTRHWDRLRPRTRTASRRVSPRPRPRALPGFPSACQRCQRAEVEDDGSRGRRKGVGRERVAIFPPPPVYFLAADKGGSACRPGGHGTPVGQPLRGFGWPLPPHTDGCFDSVERLT